MKTTVVNRHYEDFDVDISRTSKWGNPFRIGRDGTRHEVITKYLDWLLTQPALLEALPELKGKRLGCWCKPAECHGDILAELVDFLYQSDPHGYGMNVTNPHTWYKCTCGSVGCMFCDGGLSACTVCGGLEGTLTTDCCGHRLTTQEEHEIYDLGILDFRNGQWVNKPNYTRFDGDIMICVDGVRRNREEFDNWCKQLKVDPSKITESQLAKLS